MNRRFFLILLVVFFVCGSGVSFAKESLSDKYPGPWKEDFNVGISKALAKNNIRGCGQYKYRKNSKFKGEYL